MNERGKVLAGRIVSTLVVLAMLMSAGMKLANRPEVADQFVGKFGYPAKVIVGLGVAESASALLYALPWTSVLGAVLLTGYLGGAIATHLRVGDPFLAPVVIGVLVWLGLFLRDDRIRALLPFKRHRPPEGETR